MRGDPAALAALARRRRREAGRRRARPTGPRSTSRRIISIKVVDSLDAALAHIDRYGSHHTDAIVTDSHANAMRFLREVDSASVMVNASTRFADGFEYGLGAEIGISTDKLHARGPVGLEGLTSLKWIVLGQGEAAWQLAITRQRPRPLLGRPGLDRLPRLRARALRARRDDRLRQRRSAIPHERESRLQVRAQLRRQFPHAGRRASARTTCSTCRCSTRSAAPRRPRSARSR